MQRRKAYVQVTEWCLVRIGPAGAGDVHLPAPAQLKAPARLPRVLAEVGPLPLDTPARGGHPMLPTADRHRLQESRPGLERVSAQGRPTPIRTTKAGTVLACR